MLRISCLISFLNFVIHRWWPELPVVLSIFYTTAIMGDVLFHVYKQEKSTSRYTGGQSKLFKLVFKQAFLFVGAFYITWTPYLILQVSDEKSISSISYASIFELYLLHVSTCYHLVKVTTCTA